MAKKIINFLIEKKEANKFDKKVLKEFGKNKKTEVVTKLIKGFNDDEIKIN